MLQISFRRFGCLELKSEEGMCRVELSCVVPSNEEKREINIKGEKVNGKNV